MCPEVACPPPAGLVGWWPGDGNANDIVGTNNGMLQGGATATAAGVVGQAFSFDGTNGYVQIPDSPALRPDQSDGRGLGAVQLRWIRRGSGSFARGRPVHRLQAEHPDLRL